MGVVSDVIGGLFGLKDQQKATAPAAITAEKPISPVTDRATVEGTKRRRQASLLSAAPKQSTTLLNQPSGPLG